MLFLSILIWGSTLIGAASFLVGLSIWIIRYYRNGKFDWKDIKWPFGCAGIAIGLVVAIFLIVALLGALFGNDQTQDQDRYEEIFGYVPTITNDRMISNNGYDSGTRYIFLKAQVTPEERSKLMATPGLELTETPPDVVINAGQAEQFLWWPEKGGNWPQDNCDDGKVYDASGHNGWRDLTVMDCSQSTNTRREHVYMYVIAQRQDD